MTVFIPEQTIEVSEHTETPQKTQKTARKPRNSFIREDAQRDAAHCPARLCFADILKEVPKLIDESAESAEFAAENAEKIAENAENAENTAENAENFAETQKISQEAHNTHNRNQRPTDNYGIRRNPPKSPQKTSQNRCRKPSFPRRFPRFPAFSAIFSAA